MKQYDPWRPDAPIPPDIFDYIAEYVAQIAAFITVFVLMGYFAASLDPLIDPYSAAFAHWLVGWF